MSIESDFNFKGLAERMQELGILEKSFMELKKEEVVELVKAIFTSGKFSDVPF